MKPNFALDFTHDGSEKEALSSAPECHTCHNWGNQPTEFSNVPGMNSQPFFGASLPWERSKTIKSTWPGSQIIMP